MHPMIWETANIQEEQTVEEETNHESVPKCRQLQKESQNLVRTTGQGEKAPGSPGRDAVVRSGIGSLLNEVTAASKQRKTWPPRGHTRCRCEWRWDKRLRWFCCCIWAGRCTGDSQPTCKKCNKRQSQQPKLVFLLRFRSVFFSINLENVTILHFVV